MKEIMPIIKDFRIKSGEDIRNNFKIAIFERKLYSGHISWLKNAILTGKMMDRRITVYRKEKDDKMVVFDGQHRLEALEQLFDDNKLAFYDIELFIIPVKSEEEAKEIYFNLNKGKPLLVNDYMKTYNDGSNKYPLFFELKGLCENYQTSSKISFYDGLAMIVYSKTGKRWHGVSVIKSLSTVEKWETTRLKTFLKAYYFYEPIRKSYMFRKAVILPAYGVYNDNFEEFTEKKLEKFIEIIRQDQFVRMNAHILTDEIISQVKEYMERIFENKIRGE